MTLDQQTKGILPSPVLALGMEEGKLEAGSLFESPCEKTQPLGTKLNLHPPWSAWFRVQLPRLTSYAHVLALCIYTVYVESRFIYCNVIYIYIYIPFIKDNGSYK